VGVKAGGVVYRVFVLSWFDGIGGGRPVCAMTDARLMGRERSIIIDYPFVRASCIVHTRSDLSRDFLIFFFFFVIPFSSLSLFFYYYYYFVMFSSFFICCMQTGRKNIRTNHADTSQRKCFGHRNSPRSMNTAANTHSEKRASRFSSSSSYSSFVPIFFFLVLEVFPVHHNSRPSLRALLSMNK
jgi:hypothetical protein